MKLNVVKMFAMMTAATAFVGCTASTGQTSMPSSKARVQPSVLAYAGYNNPFKDSNPMIVWERLHRTPAAQLVALQSQTEDAAKNAWIELAVLSKQKSSTTQKLASELLNWREKYADHPANELIPDNTILTQMLEVHSPRQIAVLLPQSGAYGASGQIVREGFLNAYYANKPKNMQQNVKFYDTAESSNIATLYQKAIAEGADFIVGPLLKNQVQQLYTSNSFSVPTLALNYTDGSLPTNLYEFGLLPEDEASQLADRAAESGKSHALLIAPQNDWGRRLVTAFTDRWANVGGIIQDSWYYSPKARPKFNEEIAALLKVNKDTDKLLDEDSKTMLSGQRRQDFDVVILFAQPQDARIIVPLLRYYYVTSIPVFATSAVYSGKPDPIKDVDLNGIIVCDIPWKVIPTLPDGTPSHDRLYAVGQDAYKLTQSLRRLSQLSNFPLYGTTGSLTMATDQKIHRRLPCLPVRNGLL